MKKVMLFLLAISSLCIFSSTYAVSKNKIEPAPREFTIINSTQSIVKFNINLLDGKTLSTELNPFQSKKIEGTMAPFASYELFVRPEGKSTYDETPHESKRRVTSIKTVLFGITSSKSTEAPKDQPLDYEVFMTLIKTK
jgi:hypothetical protein